MQFWLGIASCQDTEVSPKDKFLSGTRLQSFPSPSVSLLGKWQFQVSIVSIACQYKGGTQQGSL